MRVEGKTTPGARASDRCRLGAARFDRSTKARSAVLLARYGNRVQPEHGRLQSRNFRQAAPINRTPPHRRSRGPYSATNDQQWYVTISRGRKGIGIFTSDKEQLRENIMRSG